MTHLQWNKKKDRENGRSKIAAILDSRGKKMPSLQNRLNYYPDSGMLYVVLHCELPFRINHQRAYSKVLRYFHSVFGVPRKEILIIEPPKKSSRKSNDYFHCQVQYYTLVKEQPTQVPDITQDITDLLKTEELYFRKFSLETNTYEVIRWDELPQSNFTIAYRRAFEGNPEKEWKSGNLWSTCSAERAAKEWVPKDERVKEDDQEVPIRRPKRKPAAACTFYI